MRRLVTNSNMFEQLGIRYFGPADGNDLETVELLLEEAKRHNGPCFVHLCTVKGKGYAPAEENPSSYHSVSGVSSLSNKYDKMSGTLGKKLSQMADSDRRVCAITAAMGDGVGLCEFEKNHADRYFDVGIAEEHALTFAAALSAAGYLPCVALYSTFFQRAYDQYIHDVALQNLRIILALDRAGFVGEDGPTHHGVFDVSMLLNVPNTQIFSPICASELEKCLDIAAESECSTVVRYPKIIRSDICRNKFNPAAEDELYIPYGHADVLIVTYGSLTANSVEACELLYEKGIYSAVYRVAKLKPFDVSSFKAMLDKTAPGFIYVLEEGMKVGGFGEYLSSVVDGYHFYIKAIEDEFVTFGNTEQLYEKYGFSAMKVAENIIEMSKNVSYESRSAII
ncbi:MAG: hypothetical protein IJO52_06400 [Clostridia bacterium]|nr:hypothetical protein [Clostridia bacterium]